ncbi:MAG: deiodinase-like protein [Flavobacteriales bacterium]
MRTVLLLAVLLVAFSTTAQSGWNPVPHKSDEGLTFRDDLDFYLNGYSKKEIKKMRHQVNIWKMNWDKMLRQAISDVRAYSEGNLNDGRTHGFTLADTQGQQRTLTEGDGKVRAFMFASITNPPSRMQLPRWDKLMEKYDSTQVELFVVYGRELHPGDNKFRDYPQPKTEAEKLAYAQQLAGTTDLPVLVDGLDDRVLNMYGQVPNACYVIDRKGRLVFRGTWADSRKVEMVVDQLLDYYKEKGS